MKFTSFNNYSNTFVFDSGKVWKTIVIFWWIHWCEISWVKVVDKLVEDFSRDKIKLLKWKIILAYWNEEAIKIWQRDYKYNLNRLFREEYLNSNSSDYEIKRAKELSKIMDNSDTLLDIHSVSSESEPFMFCENIDDEKKIAKSIYNWKIIVWWWEIAWTLLSWDTDWYMHKQWKVSFTLETWNHNLPWAFEIWYEVSLKLLKYFELIENENNFQKSTNQMIKMYKIQTTITWKFSFVWWVYNFKKISKWELIWVDWENNIYASEDFIILLPNYEKTKPWDEIFYYWKEFN